MMRLFLDQLLDGKTIESSQQNFSVNLLDLTQTGNLKRIKKWLGDASCSK
jgi:hypothetical protein